MISSHLSLGSYYQMIITHLPDAPLLLPCTNAPKNQAISVLNNAPCRVWSASAVLTPTAVIVHTQKWYTQDTRPIVIDRRRCSCVRITTNTVWWPGEQKPNGLCLIYYTSLAGNLRVRRSPVFLPADLTDVAREAPRVRVSSIANRSPRAPSTFIRTLRDCFASRRQCVHNRVKKQYSIIGKFAYVTTYCAIQS